VRGHLLDMLGDTATAVGHFEAAANRTMSTPERNYLTAKAARLRHGQEEVAGPGAPHSRAGLIYRENG
jgi:hypothetical protein